MADIPTIIEKYVKLFFLQSKKGKRIILKIKNLNFLKNILQEFQKYAYNISNISDLYSHYNYYIIIKENVLYLFIYKKKK